MGAITEELPKKTRRRDEADTKEGGRESFVLY
jgi:hypothetical protein